ncbi:MAG TPA: exodeoxyribonuclease VII large subunit [Vicinamibacteria bacterium]|nr:exodeoxyribonuclease VII large subunit [Vicinamibacteria bacterium]
MEQKGLDFGIQPQPGPPRRRTLSVSELTDRIQGVLEVDFADVWVEGEISNLKTPPSGHFYFSLKDENAQIRAVVWKSDARLIRFRPQDGMKVVARGSVRVYPPRGDYQLSVQVLEPLGKGSLQQAFEDLKERLGKEGLFDPGRKRPLPMLPRRVGLVTSPTGAVLQDILRVLAGRYSNLGVLLYPARVQGPEAVWEIVAGIRVLNRIKGLDVLIVARGGGSLEDLWPFNDEAVARALAASEIPTISAVGHETDFTIADFVADFRAPTPSAAAERVVRAKVDLIARVTALEQRLAAAIRLRLARTRARVERVTSHRVFEVERGRIRNHAQRVDELGRRGEKGLLRAFERARDGLRHAAGRIEAFRWDRQVAAGRERVTHQWERAQALFRAGIGVRRAALSGLAGKLDSLSPLAVLSRGYALVWDGSGRHLLRDPGPVRVGDALLVRLHGGRLGATVTSKEPA